MLRVLAVIAAFALLVYALSDFATSDERDRGGIPKWLWVIIIVVLVYFGPLAWIAYSRSRRSAAAAPTTRGGYPGAAPRGRRRPGQPVAPDDDPDFLWRLARDQREQARKERGTGTGTAAEAPSTSPDDDVAPDAPGTDHGDLLADDPRGDAPDDLLPDDPRGDAPDDLLPDDPRGDAPDDLLPDDPRGDAPDDLLPGDPRGDAPDDLLPGDPRGDSTDDVDGSGGGTTPKGPSV